MCGWKPVLDLRNLDGFICKLMLKITAGRQIPSIYQGTQWYGGLHSIFLPLSHLLCPDYDWQLNHTALYQELPVISLHAETVFSHRSPDIFLVSRHNCRLCKQSDLSTSWIGSQKFSVQGYICRVGSLCKQKQGSALPKFCSKGWLNPDPVVKEPPVYIPSYSFFFFIPSPQHGATGLGPCFSLLLSNMS